MSKNTFITIRMENKSMKIKKIVAEMIVLAIIMAMSGCSGGGFKYPYGLTGNEKSMDEIINKLDKKLKTKPSGIYGEDETDFRIYYIINDDNNDEYREITTIAVEKGKNYKYYTVYEEIETKSSTSNYVVTTDDVYRVYNKYQEITKKYGEPTSYTSWGLFYDDDKMKEIYTSKTMLNKHLNDNGFFADNIELLNGDIYLNITKTKYGEFKIKTVWQKERRSE